MEDSTPTDEATSQNTSVAAPPDVNSIEAVELEEPRQQTETIDDQEKEDDGEEQGDAKITKAKPAHIHEVHVQVNQNNPGLDKTKKQRAESNAEANDEIPSQSKIDTEKLIAEICLICPKEQMRRHIQLYEYGRGTEHIRKKLSQITNEQLTNLLVFLNNKKDNKKKPNPQEGSGSRYNR